MPPRGSLGALVSLFCPPFCTRRFGTTSSWASLPPQTALGLQSYWPRCGRSLSTGTPLTCESAGRCVSMLVCRGCHPYEGGFGQPSIVHKCICTWVGPLKPIRPFKYAPLHLLPFEETFMSKCVPTVASDPPMWYDASTF